MLIANQIGYKRAESTWLGNLGSIFFELRKSRKAIKYYNRALKISKEIGFLEGENHILGNLDNAYTNLGNYKKAFGYHEDALRNFRKIGGKRGEASILANLGLSHYMLEEVEKCKDCLRKALVIFESNESPDSETVSLWLKEIENE